VAPRENASQSYFGRINGRQLEKPTSPLPIEKSQILDVA
jgi:hypothetical protein